MSPGAIGADLGRLLGSERVLVPERGSPYLTDASGRRGLEGQAEAVALPGDAAQVAAVLGWCYEHDVPLVARGGGTGLVGGAVPSAGSVVCSLEHLRGVREMEPGLWRMSVEAGVTTRHVQRLARENGLFFGPDPGGADQAQIGGNVATNAGGPHALKYGVTGAWVAGLEAALAPGELVEIGGWIRKDVSGYDLKDLLIGSEGTLGIVTAVRLRLLPAPESRIAMVAFLAGREEGCAAALGLLAGGLRPSVLDFLDGETLEIAGAAYPPSRGTGPDGPRGEVVGVPRDAGFGLLVEVDGSQAEAAAQRAEAIELLDGAAVAVQEPLEEASLWRWRDGINPAVTGARGAKVSGDVVVPLERLAECLARFEQTGGRHGLRSCAWGHAGEGNVHATVLVDPASPRELDAAEEAMEDLYGTVVELGGSIAGEHGVGVVKAGQLARQWPERAVALHEGIKELFDPKNLLNPGKKLAR